jgi:hypothetical protein
LRLFDFVLEPEIPLAGLVKSGTALAHYAGNDFFRLDPDGVTFTGQCFSAQLISPLLPLLVFDNVGLDVGMNTRMNAA